MLSIQCAKTSHNSSVCVHVPSFLAQYLDLQFVWPLEYSGNLQCCLIIYCLQPSMMEEEEEEETTVGRRLQEKLIHINTLEKVALIFLNQRWGKKTEGFSQKDRRKRKRSNCITEQKMCDDLFWGKGLFFFSSSLPQSALSFSAHLPSVQLPVIHTNKEDSNWC